MTLLRWNPATLTSLRDVDRVNGEMSRLFDNFYGPIRDDDNGTSAFAPPVDIEETRDHFIVRLDLRV